MKNTFKMLSLSLLICLCVPLLAFAKEGMGKIGGDNNSAILRYTYDDDSYAVNEWKQVWDNWYYFGEDGISKQNTWAEIDGKWYYFDEWSRMLHDTTTPDGYYVGPDGAWVKTEKGNDIVLDISVTQ